jgi:GNAT superfamily N-acetyltransferase
MSVTIEAFSPARADAVARLVLGIQRDEFEIPITLEEQPDLKDIPAFFQHGGGDFWVALDDGQVVGTIALQNLGHGQAALRKMFVAATHRGPTLRVAHRLLDTLIEWARAHEINMIVLGTTEAFTAAHRFYEKNGFVRIEREDLPKNFSFIVDTRFYRLDL